jgi:nucleotide-binding universal stress UspA family protein
MTQHDEAKWVVVGIDGSQAAIDAARWTVDEALSLNVPLRLVHVIPPDSPAACPNPMRRPTFRIRTRTRTSHHPKRRQARASRNSHPARAPDRVLIDESREAAIICVGSVGRGRLARMPLGSTAAALANHAHCAVAIVRTAASSQTENGWIVAVLNDNDAVVHRAMAEARLRKTSVLLIDRRVDSWIRRYPDVTVHTIAENSRVMRPIENHGESVQLVIVGSADADNVARLVDYNCHPVLRYVNAPVLLIRQ